MSSAKSIPHAMDRLGVWLEAWRRSGSLVLLLDFDGTLAPIVERPELATILAEAREALERLVLQPGLTIAVVSGRGLDDARRRAGIPGIIYAGNHGMEIDGPGIQRVHAEAAASRPLLDEVVRRLEPSLASVPGAILEDKGLTLSVHFRMVARGDVERVLAAVDLAVSDLPGVRVTGGKEVLEVRPRVDWHKGRAVEFLLQQLNPPPGAPAIYIGDDRTDEDAFTALRAWADGSGEGVVVAEPPPSDTAAGSFLRAPREVADLLARFARSSG